MNYIEHLRVVQFFLSLGILWFVYAYMYRRTRADRFREDLFTIRDELFDFMWKNQLPYEFQAYQLMRDSFNGMIREAHLIRLTELVAYVFFTRKHHTHYRLINAMSEIEDESVRDHFFNVYNKVRKRLLNYLFLEGPQWILFKPIELLLRFMQQNRTSSSSVSIRDKAAKLAREFTDELADDFVDFGKPDSQQAHILQRVAPARTR